MGNTLEEVKAKLINDDAFLNASEPDQRRMIEAGLSGKPLPTIRSEPGLGSQITRGLLEGGGMVGGGILAAPLGPVGAAAGGILGYAGGKSLADAILEPAPSSMGEAISRTGTNLMQGAQIEAGGRLVGKAVEGLGNLIKPLSGSRAEVGGIADRMGVDLTPAEVSQNKPTALMEGALRRAPLSAGILQRFDQQRLSQLMAERDRLVSTRGSKETLEEVGLAIKDELAAYAESQGAQTVGQKAALTNQLLATMGSPLSYEELGAMGQQALVKGSQARRDAVKSLYDAAGEMLAPGTRVNLPSTKAVADKWLAEIAKSPPSIQSQFGPMRAILQDLAGSGNAEFDAAWSASAQGTTGLPAKVLDQLKAELSQQHPPGFEYPGLQMTLATLNKIQVEHNQAFGMAQKGAQFQADPVAKIAGELKAAIQGDLETLAGQEGGQFAIAMKLARAADAAAKSVFRKDDVQRLLRANPEKAIDALVKPGGTSTVRLVRETLGDAQFEPFKQAMTNKLLGIGKETVLKGSTLRANLAHYTDDTLKEVYQPAELSSLKDLARELDKADAAPLSNKFFRLIANTNAELVVDRIVRPNNTENLKRLERTLGPDAVQRVKEAWVSKLLQNEPGGDLSPVKFVKRMESYGQPTLTALLKPEELKEIRDLAKVSLSIRGAEQLGGNPSGTAQVGWVFANGAMVVHSPIAGLTMAIGPPAMAKVYLSKRGRALMRSGMNLPQDSAKYAEISTKLLAIANEGSNETTE
jgi:hypothetical protein